MWVFLESEVDTWSVGFFRPDGRFHPMFDFRNKYEAAMQVNFLNGGYTPPVEEEEEDDWPDSVLDL